MSNIHKVPGEKLNESQAKLELELVARARNAEQTDEQELLVKVVCHDF